MTSTWRRGQQATRVVLFVVLAVTAVAAQEDESLPARNGHCPMDLSPNDHCLAAAAAPSVHQINATAEKEGGLDTLANSGGGRAGKCQLYLAESSIPNAGMGIYTAVDLNKGDQVGHPDLAIPIIDISFHNTHLGDDFFFLLDDYNWEASTAGVYNEADYTDVFSPGFGAAVNCDLGLVNVKEGKVHYSSAGLHRQSDVGVGAFTGYHGRTTHAVKNVPAGAELFVSYGESYFDTRNYDNAPRESDYDEADKFLKKFDSVFQKYDSPQRGKVMEDLWEVVTETLLEPRVRNSYPSTFQGVQRALRADVRWSRTEETMRSPEWLERNGKCVDNIYAARSTLRQAGRGAFASRFVPSGGLVAPMPLAHIPDRDVLNIYDKITDAEGLSVPDRDNVLGTQLLLNYCFGHTKSTVLLCPYGAITSFVNHDSNSPNAKIQWAVGPGSNHHPQWLDESVDILALKHSSGLAFDMVATRDIHPGEEIFIDYGPEFERAWTDHVRSWMQHADDRHGAKSPYMRASELDKHAGAVKTQEEEKRGQSYPSNVQTFCYCGFDEESEFDTDGLVVRQWKYSDMSSEMHPCEIKSRVSVLNETSYTVRVHFTSDDEKEDNPAEDDIVILTHVPRMGIVLLDKKYSGDEHLPDAFRHEMMIPDTIFPKAWLNKA